jgi:hypothetical protein
MKSSKSGLVIIQRCSGCKQQIDIYVCWCGTGANSHSYEEHQFVPYGCECLMFHQTKRYVPIIWNEEKESF